MDQIKFVQFIRTKLSECEKKIANTTDVELLMILCDYNSVLKMVDQQLSSLSLKDIYKGRKVAEVKAKNKTEALVAIDMLKDVIKDQGSNSINESVYVTNEGSIWGG